MHIPGEEKQRRDISQITEELNLRIVNHTREKFTHPENKSYTGNSMDGEILEPGPGLLPVIWASVSFGFITMPSIVCQVLCQVWKTLILAPSLVAKTIIRV